MSAGYTPVFQSIYTGTLYGRWPAAAVWASLLPLFDKNGHLDMSLQAIAGMTGWPVDLLRQGIEQLMEPDPQSRTDAEEGRRMVPLEEGRGWGWRAVNHEKYREKARLSAKSAREVAEGKNEQRMADRRRPPETAGDRRPPPATPSQTQTQTHREGAADAAPPKARKATQLPADWHWTSTHQELAAELGVAVSREAVQFQDHHRAKGSTFKDWDAAFRTWLRNAAKFTGGKPAPAASKWL